MKTFADQAAIAIENVRLFNETKEALEQQKASAEILATISSSIADTKPVFEKIVASCAQLFDGDIVGIPLVQADGTMTLAAYHGPAGEAFARRYPLPVDARTGAGASIIAREVRHYPDIEAADVPSLARESFRVNGVRSAIFAPMLWEHGAIGAIFVGRRDVGPFSEKEIALLRTFANQAVIAIQNARLVNETREALEQQRASTEVLGAISSSIADTGPVFEKIVSSCEALFAGKVAVIDVLREDGRVYLGAYHGPNRDQVQDLYPHSASETSATGTAMARREIVPVLVARRGARLRPRSLRAFRHPGRHRGADDLGRPRHRRDLGRPRERRSVQRQGDRRCCGRSRTRP